MLLLLLLLLSDTKIFSRGDIGKQIITFFATNINYDSLTYTNCAVRDQVLSKVSGVKSVSSPTP